MDLQVCLIECDHVSEIPVKTVRLFHQNHAAVRVFPEVRQHRIESRPSHRLGSLNVGELLDAQVLFGAVATQQLLLGGNAIPQFLLFARHARVEDRFTRQAVLLSCQARVELRRGLGLFGRWHCELPSPMNRHMQSAYPKDLQNTRTKLDRDLLVRVEPASWSSRRAGGFWAIKLAASPGPKGASFCRTAGSKSEILRARGASAAVSHDPKKW